MAPRTRLLKLDFHEKLIQSGKGTGTDALIKRLKTLHQKLKVLEQETTDTKSLNAIRHQLIDTVILHHKDRGVKAYASCCLADLLRLYAPDAPYSADELRDIFQFFLVQITQNLKLSPNGTRPLGPSKKSNAGVDGQTTQAAVPRLTEVPYYTEYAYLIESLSTIKSIVLVCELPNAEDVMTSYFEGFVQVVRPDMSKTLLRHLVTCLTELLLEVDLVPGGVMDCILGQFTNYSSKPETPSFQLITDVCNRSATKLQRPVYAHVSEIQLAHGRDPSPADLENLTDSHSLILSIYRYAPGLLLNIIPMLEENLRAADEIPLRQLSTETLGAMFGERPVVSGVVSTIRAYPSAWRAWLGRKVDKAHQVRLAWVEAATQILINNPEVSPTIESDLIDRLLDSDERVRAAICKAVGTLDYEVVLHNISQKLLKGVGVRVSDKKAVVRSAAIDTLATLWDKARSEIEANDEDAIDHFGWIPQELLMAQFSAPEMSTQIALTFKHKILPLPDKADDEQGWVDRFLLVASRLTESGLKALDKLTGLVSFARGGSPFGTFISLCKSNNGGLGDDEAAKQFLSIACTHIAKSLFTDAEKSRNDLEAFAALNEPRIYKLFQALVDPQSDLRVIIKSRLEFLRRLEQSHDSIRETMSTVADCAAWSIINHSSIPGLIRRLQKSEGADAERTQLVASHYLALIAKECAPMFKSHVPELLIIINDKKNDSLVEVGFQALAAVTKWDQQNGPSDRRHIDRAIKVALTGTPRQAKFASRFLAVCSDKEAPGELVDSIWELLENDEGQLLPLLRACAELAISAPLAFENRSTEIIGFIMNDVLLRRSPSEEDLDEKWVEEDQLETLDRAKLIGLRVCTHRALGWARDENGLEQVSPTLNLLTQVLKNNGQVSSETNEGGGARCHMRLRAALCMLKLANVRTFDKAMSPFFVDLAFTLQDVNYTVRNKLLKKLGDVLQNQRLSPKWNMLPILVAQDPEPDNIHMARSIMTSIVKRTATSSFRPEDRVDRVEMPLARLLHLLTQHPDLDWENEQDLKDMSRFIELFIDCIARKDNASLLYTIANKLKTVCVAGEDMDDAKVNLILSSDNKHRPGQEEESNMDQDDVADIAASASVNLYKLSELAQIIIRNRSQQHQWPMSSYPGKIRLPRDLFNLLPTPQIAQQVVSRTYLSEAVTTWAKNYGRRSTVTNRRSSATEGSGDSRKRTRKAPTAPRKKRRPSKPNDDDDDDEDDSESSDDDSSDEEESEAEEGNGVGEPEAEGDAGEAVMGRGGRRNAKLKANKAVTRRKKNKTKKQESPRKDDAQYTGSEELSDASG